MGFHYAAFGTLVGDSVWTLLYKRATGFPVAGEVDVEVDVPLTDDLDMSDYHSLTFYPHEDYTLDGRAPEPVEVSSDDEFVDAQNLSFQEARFGPHIKLTRYCCYNILSIAEVGDAMNLRYLEPISPELMAELQTLSERLQREGRIKGGFVMMGNCCS